MTENLPQIGEMHQTTKRTPNPQGETMKAILKNILTGLALLAASAASSPAAEYTWTGGGGDDNWKTGANWGGTAPGASQTLIFSGTTRLTPYNDNTSGWGVYGIRFNAGAGAFTLSGNSIALSGGVTNNSTSTQTLGLNMTTGGHLIFDTAAGDIVSTKGIGGTHSIRKEGLGSLTLKGNNTWSGGVFHLGGTLVYDYSSGGSLPSTGSFYFGTYGGGGKVLANTARLELTGTTSASLPTMDAGTYTNAANMIKVGAGMTVIINSLGGMTSVATTNFDLTASGANITFTTSPGLTYGVLPQGTVTDSVKTGFATVSSGTLQRFTAFDGPLDGGYNIDKNYTLSGNQSIGAANKNTVTITGGGSLAIAAGNTLLTKALLMEEGVSDFTMNAVVRGASASLLIHQYSTDGVLILNERINDADVAYGLIKTGPGTVRIAGSSNSSYTGETFVQDGLLQVDGSLTKTAKVTVFDGAELSGAGAIGSSSNATALTIRAGAALSGTASAAMDITGTLTLDSKSTFTFTLGGNGTDSVQVSGSVTLASGANLQLSLNGAPTLDTPLYLLRSGNSTITGSFTYNGTTMTDGSTFSLGGYDFTYGQDTNDIWVQAVPEPSAVLLFGLGLSAILFRRRRR